MKNSARLLTALLFVSIGHMTHAEPADGGRSPASYRPTPAANSPESSLPTEQQPSADETDDFGLTGHWGGARKTFKENGYSLGVIYKGDLNRAMGGGAPLHNSYIQNLDLRLLIDGEKAAGLKGWSFFIYGLANHGADRANTPGTYVGAEQGVNNIETISDGFRLYEAWVEKTLFDDKASLLVGLHDLNSEFYVTDTSAIFINPSFGIGRDLSQTGMNGPSIFPYTSLALRAKVEPTENFYFQAAAFEAYAGDLDHPRGTHIRMDADDGQLLIGEAGLNGSEEHPGKYAVGYWTYSHEGNNCGAYFLGDHSFTKNFSTFLRYGIVDPKKNDVRDNLSFGAVYKGLIPSRDDDRIGLGVTRVTPTSTYRQSSEDAGTFLHSHETIYEFTYRIDAGHGIAVQPDFQIVEHSGFASDIKNVPVGNIRVEVSF